MKRSDRLRISLGVIREGDPNAWRCFVCRRWTNRDECGNHKFRVMREPTGPRPSPAAVPPR